MLWKMGFSAAKILPCPPYMPLGTIEIREGFGPLELSKGFSTVCGQRRRALALNYLQKRLKTKSIKKKNRLHAQPVL